MAGPSPNEVVDLNHKFPCRELQVHQLSCLLSPSFPSPSSIVLHGLEATGKSTIIKGVLDSSFTPYAIVHNRECITGRHLLEKTLSACLGAVEQNDTIIAEKSRYNRCENVGALAVQLQRLLSGVRKFVLVFDGIDHQREAPQTLLPALARFGEFIPNLTIVFIVTFPSQRFLHKLGVPHVHFPSYTREEALRIVTISPLQIFDDSAASQEGEDEEEDDPVARAEDDVWLWTRFCAAVWDSLAKGAARDVVSFRSLAEKIWRPFVASIVDGTYGTRDFSRLMVAKRALFQGDEQLAAQPVVRTEKSATQPKKASHDLSYFAKFLLCAAYLASFNPARQDPVFFMQSTEKKRKRKGGGVGRPAKHRKVPRRLLAPLPFSLGRMLAIFHAILPQAVAPSADIHTHIATLTTLRLLLRSGVGSNGDALDPNAKWKVNIGYDYVVKMGRSVNFEIQDYLAE